ncbi:MAG TPA: NADH-ubiquinone oxidoreductase-F iron-sulfur binding region domain-containing protein [Myxococcota bacterium]|nr:NADH-ubiquinone oxidoreductase-F iron-sulfur binding region domain-containing protein [Myxococcota bacterium]
MDGPAQARARDSYFADRHADPHAVRVCRGTSCALARGPELWKSLAPGEPWRSIACAGHCDRSPVVLDRDGRAVQLRERAGRLARAELPVRPDVRVRARVPVVLERVAHGEFHPLSRALDAGVWRAFERAVRGEPAALLCALEASGECGRGGGAFPTGAKWRAASSAPGRDKVVVANGDEGDPGSFVDRVLLEADPHAVLEGLALCAFATGARHGIVYVRSEYPRAAERVEAAIAEAERAGLLGRAIRGSGFELEVRVVRGEGSYVCGEETALLNALEGKRGEVRLRPPYPTRRGLFGRPTVVNNVETLVNAAWIARHGAPAYRALGTAASRGTKVVSLNAGFAFPGLVEVEFGTSLAAVIDEAVGRVRLAAVAIGGPMGSIALPDEWDVPICWEAMRGRGIALGHGGLVALPEGTDFAALAQSWLEFMASESCGKCVPCRVGSREAVELARANAHEPLLELLDVVSAASLCPFGQDLPRPVRTILTRLAARGSGA